MINVSIGLIGAALQTDKDTPATAPTFTHGLTGGKVANLERSIESASVSCGVRAGTDSYVASIASGLDFDAYCYADVLPLYLYGCLGAIASKAATKSGFYEHTVTLGDVLPYLTFWGRIGSEYTRTDGCKVDQIEMEFEGNKPVSFGVTANGTFKLDTASDTATDAPVISGALTLANSCSTAPLAGQISPGSVDEGKLTSSGNVKVRPDDLSLYKAMITGSPTGTVPTGKIVYGSFEWEFTHSKDADYKMTVKATHVPFTAEFPEVSPDGGSAEIQFDFADIGIDSRGGSPVEITVTNATESYI